MSSFTTKKEAISARLQQRINRISNIGAGTARRDQLLALLLVPFVFILSMTVATVLKDIITSLVPNTGALAPVLFLAGVVLFILALATNFIWVKTGGFGIFAD